MIEAFHLAAGLEGVSPSLLIDMQGPELRIGVLERAIPLSKGQEAVLIEKGAFGETSGAIPIPPEIFDHYEPGMILLIDDGKIQLRAEKLFNESGTGRRITARALADGTTGQDLENLRCAYDAGVTDVMQPFVRGAADMREVRKAMEENGAGHCRLFAKIENRDGIRAVDEILPLTDMLVIARGDLGNAVPLWELPRVQKEISLKCIAADIPFMVVTQMLASMERSPVPTRAEVSDIFNAVCDGAGAVMITGESASGLYPVRASQFLVKTAQEGLRWRERIRLRS